MRLWIGPNGPLPREITAMHPNAPHIKRNGEVNAWDNEDFRNAVKATGKTQIIIGGITTDVSIVNLNIPFSTRDAHQRWSFCFLKVCTAFLALSLIEEGYTVYANADASGALSERIASDANDRMRDAGVHVLSSFAVVVDLMRDWRNTPGAVELFPYFDKWAHHQLEVVMRHWLLFFLQGISPPMGSLLVVMLLPLIVVPFFLVNLSNASWNELPGVVQFYFF